jgi:hypothetical protein
LRQVFAPSFALFGLTNVGWCVHYIEHEEVLANK